MLRAAVLVGVSVVVTPITAMRNPFLVMSVHGVAQSGRAVPPVLVMLADKNGYFASLRRARSVSIDQSNSWFPMAVASIPRVFKASIVPRPYVAFDSAVPCI